MAWRDNPLRVEKVAEKMKTIDFRARPNTAEYMKMHTGPANARVWERFGYAEPPAVSIEQFGADLAANQIDYGVFTGRQRVANGIIASGVTNDYVAECVSKLNGRLIGFAGIDPTAGPAAVSELRRSVKELGLRGISLDPQIAQLVPDDRRIYPVYETAQELGVPVVITMGPLVGRFGDPMSVDQVAVDFPELTIVCSHGCWPQVTDFIAMAYRRDNVYLEASIYEFLPGAEPFIAAANSLIRERVVYASAFPFNPLNTLQRFSQLHLSQESRAMIMYRNAARILGLPA